MISLWQDVAPTISRQRPPQPLFFRSNTQDTIQFWHTNLVPNYYELDDFQVRTPTDIIGEHIHLVKFDVTSSDGASNGFNYESGTFSPEEVRERIYAINQEKGLYAFDPATGYVDKNGKRELLEVKKVKDYYPGPGSEVTVDETPAGPVPVITKDGKPAELSIFGKPPGGDDEWDGAQTTVELWGVDPLLNNEGVDRTLRTVFTHDHFSPSTHQQAGLYAGLVIEPEDSLWYLTDGTRMNTRQDGGPTSWNGYIVPKDPKESYREFMLEFQDLQLAYAKGSRKEVSSSMLDPGTNPEKPLTSSAAFDLSQAHSIPELETKSFPAYVKLLNKEELPTGSEDQLAAGFPELFLQFGVPLSPKAKVKKIKENAWWTITEADGQINAGVTYIVRAFTDTIVQSGKTVPGFITHMLVYTPDVSPGWSDSTFALNPPSDSGNNTPYGFPDGPPNGPPFPGLVSTGSAGTYSVNYRNEPVPLRLGGTAPTPEQSDLALVFSSIPRADADLNLQPDPLDLVKPQLDDPFTPLLEAYANDKVQVRTLVGAHVQSHAFEIHGV